MTPFKAQARGGQHGLRSGERTWALEKRVAGRPAAAAAGCQHGPAHHHPAAGAASTALSERSVQPFRGLRGGDGDRVHLNTQGAALKRSVAARCRVCLVGHGGRARVLGCAAAALSEAEAGAAGGAGGPPQGAAGGGAGGRGRGQLGLQGLQVAGVRLSLPPHRGVLLCLCRRRRTASTEPQQQAALCTADCHDFFQAMGCWCELTEVLLQLLTDSERHNALLL